MRRAQQPITLATNYSHNMKLILLFLILLPITQLANPATDDFSIANPATDDFSIAGYELTSYSSASEELKLFEQWRAKHGKVYVHPVEKARRFENFLKNLAYVRERNKRKDSSVSSFGHAVGLNVFADLSNEEFRELYVSKISRRDGKKMIKRRLVSGSKGKESCEAPYALDWRKKRVVTAVKDQGGCGSCWAFSSTGAMESINAITTGDVISLSEQELVDCDKTNDGCEGGFMDYAFEWVVANGGIDTETNYPYTGVDETCNTKKEKIKAVTIDGYQDVDPEESALLCAVVKQPVSVGIYGSSQDFQLYTGGVYDGDCSSNPNDINHAVLIVGYASQGSVDYWIVKNSWGTSWGIQGYIYIKRNTYLPYGVCAVNSMASYPTKEATTPTPFPSPVVPPPPPPPRPSPSPSKCGDLSYCPSGETCCCFFEYGGFCLIYGCCAYENAVCCPGTEYCCPQDYPICDAPDGLCLKKSGNLLAVATKKKKLAKHKLPWTKMGEAPNRHQPLIWKRGGLEALR